MWQAQGIIKCRAEVALDVKLPDKPCGPMRKGGTGCLLVAAGGARIAVLGMEVVGACVLQHYVPASHAHTHSPAS